MCKILFNVCVCVCFRCCWRSWPVVELWRETRSQQICTWLEHSHTDTQFRSLTGFNNYQNNKWNIHVMFGSVSLWWCSGSVEISGGRGSGQSNRFVCSSLEETAGPPADLRSVLHVLIMVLRINCSCLYAVLCSCCINDVSAGGAAEPDGCMEMVALACRCLDKRRKKRPSMTVVRHTISLFWSMMSRDTSA